jgi:Glyoxalase-like domain
VRINIRKTTGVGILVFKDLCLDSVEPVVVGQFWADLLGLMLHERPNGGVFLSGASAQQTIWINAVPEKKAVKLRVHLDVSGPSIEFFEQLGAARIATDRLPWTVVGDPEQNEFCVFLPNGLHDERSDDFAHGELKSVVFDSIDCAAQATWWAEVLDASVVHYPDYSSVVAIDGTPFRSLDFVNVPELKSTKNRLHLDFIGADLDPLVERGARILRSADYAIAWNVLCDREGNEFCVHTP